MRYLIGLMGCLVIGLALGCDAGDLERVPPGGEAPMGQNEPAAKPAPHIEPTPSPYTTSPDAGGRSATTPEEDQRTIAPAVTEEPATDLPKE